MSIWIKDRERFDALKAKLQSAIEESGCVYSEVMFALSDLSGNYKAKSRLLLNSMDFNEILKQDATAPFASLKK